MPERVLCEGDLRISIDGGGERTLLVVTDSISVRFWTDTALLEAALCGDPVQLSTHGSFCQIDVKNGQALLVFGVPNHGPRRCEFPAQRLSDALSWVRSLGNPYDPQI